MRFWHAICPQGVERGAQARASAVRRDVQAFNCASVPEPKERVVLDRFQRPAPNREMGARLAMTGTSSQVGTRRASRAGCPPTAGLLWQAAHLVPLHAVPRPSTSTLLLYRPDESHLRGRTDDASHVCVCPFAIGAPNGPPAPSERSTRIRVQRPIGPGRRRSPTSTSTRLTRFGAVGPIRHMRWASTVAIPNMAGRTSPVSTSATATRMGASGHSGSRPTRARNGANGEDGTRDDGTSRGRRAFR
jgi:hypothetical protein